MEIKQAQSEVRHAFFAGAPGVLVSALAWMLAGVISIQVSAFAGIIALFFGGMLIHPGGLLLCKTLGRNGRLAPENFLTQLAIETTVVLFVGMFIAFSVAQLQVDWFFPIMLLTIGGRYVIFATLYGMRIYWILGGLLALSGVGFLLIPEFIKFAAIGGALVELVFAAIIFQRHRKASQRQLAAS